MVIEVGKSGKSKKIKMASIRRMLYKYGDIPRSEVNKATSMTKAKEWVAIFDARGNVLSAGRVEQSDWYAFTLKNLFTVPSARGKGLGTSIVKKLMMLATRRGAKVLIADVTTTNRPSKKIFLKLGFKVVSRFKWAKNEKPADILHFVLYPPRRKKKPIRQTSKPLGLRLGSGISLGSRVKFSKVSFKF